MYYCIDEKLFGNNTEIYIFEMNNNKEIISIEDIYGNEIRKFNTEIQIQFSYIHTYSNYIKSKDKNEVKYKLFLYLRKLYLKNKMKIDIKYILNFLDKHIEYKI